MTENETLYMVCKSLNNFFIKSPTTIVDVEDEKFTGQKPFNQFTNFVLLQEFGMYRYEVLGDEIILNDLQNEYHSLPSVEMNFCFVPSDFLALVIDIKNFNDSELAKPTNIKSETISNVYSVTKATNADGVVAGWQDIFANRLAPFRRAYTGAR